MWSMWERAKICRRRVSWKRFCATTRGSFTGYDATRRNGASWFRLGSKRERWWLALRSLASAVVYLESVGLSSWSISRRRSRSAWRFRPTCWRGRIKLFDNAGKPNYDGRIQLNSPSVQSRAKSLLLSLDESLSLSIVILTFLHFRPHDT